MSEILKETKYINKFNELTEESKQYIIGIQQALLFSQKSIPSENFSTLERKRKATS